jgi:predicted GIY-YIG superfamily endonuclease
MLTAITLSSRVVELILSYITELDGVAPEPVSAADEYLCYIVKSVDSMRTYAGITNNMTRRLRQHNGTLAGGAKYTSKPHSRPWSIVLTVHGFQSKVQVLQFEWALHHVKGRGGVAARMSKLLTVLRKTRWTRSAPPACTVPLCLRVRGSTLPPGLDVDKLPRYVTVTFIDT